MSGAIDFFNRFVRYTEVKFEGEWQISGGEPGLLTPPGFVTYTAVIQTDNPPQIVPSVTITRSDGKELIISAGGTTTYIWCAVGEDVIALTALPGQSSDGPFQ